MFLYDLAYITKPLQNSVCPGTAYLIINRLRFPRIPVRESCLGLITGFRRSFKIMSQERPVPPAPLQNLAGRNRQSVRQVSCS